MDIEGYFQQPKKNDVLAYCVSLLFLANAFVQCDLQITDFVGFTVHYKKATVIFFLWGLIACCSIHVIVSHRKKYLCDSRLY